MKRVLAGVAAVLVILAGSGPAFAQTAPTPRQLELAHQIIDATGQKKNMVGLMRTMMLQISEASMRGVPQDQRASTQVMNEAMAAAMEKMAPRVLDVTAEAYAKTYTEDELVQILAFMRSPAGQVMNAKGPQLAQNIMAGSLTIGPELAKAWAVELCATGSCPPQMKALADAPRP